MTIKTFLLLALLFVSGAFNAQKSDFTELFSNAVFQNYTMKNGLVSNYCSDVLQDKRGYIWVSTVNGINRFNGSKWRSFQQQSVNKKDQIRGNWVVDMSKDEVGNVWFNTDNGVAKYNEKTAQIVYENLPVRGWGHVLASHKTLIVSSWIGLDQYNLQTKIKAVKTYEETSANSITCLYKENNQSFWVCPEDNPCLIQLNPETKKVNYIRSILFEGKQASPVIVGVDGYDKDTLLLATSKFGILKYCISTQTAVAYLPLLLPKLNAYTCSRIYMLKSQKYILIGSANAGLFVVNCATNEVVSYKHDQNNPTGVLSNFVNAVEIDNNNGFWLATTKGMSYFHPSLQKNKSYFFYNTSNLSSVKNAITINFAQPINNSQFLIATEGNGLLWYDKKTDVLRKIPLSNPVSTKVSSIYKKSDDFYLVGSNRGLYIYGASNETCTLANLLKDKLKNALINVFKIKLLENGNIGICTSNGVIIYNFEKQETIYSELDLKLTDESILITKDICQQGDEIFIVRFFTSSLKYNLKTKVRTLTCPRVLIGKPIDFHNAIIHKNEIYTSSTQGLIIQNCANPNKYKILTSKDGLAGDKIENVILDNNGLIYYTTSDGLYSYHLAKKENKRLLSYENFVQKWFNQLSRFGNNLIFNSGDFFISYALDLEHRNDKAPDFYLESIQINGEETNFHQGEIKLKHNQNNLTFSFAGLVYPESNKNTWKYRLNKIETKEKVSSGEITFNNLPPNDYVLELYSENNEGVKSNDIQKIYFTIASPFHKTWWFLSLVFVAIVAFIYFILEYRQHQRLRVKEIRNQISRDLHDELGANVSSINIMSNLLLSQENQNNPVVQNISKYTNQISNTINDIIWNVNPKFDRVEELIKKMVRFASESLDAAKIDFTMSLPDATIEKDVDNHIKYQIYLMFKETINNTSKYSKATLVQIEIRFTEKEFYFKVNDNGIGFDQDANEMGNGLNNLTTRAKDLKAILKIDSKRHIGTKITLSVNIP